MDEAGDFGEVEGREGEPEYTGADDECDGSERP